MTKEMKKKIEQVDLLQDLVEKAEKDAFVPKEMTELDCPDCGKKLQKIWASSKYFYATIV